MNTIRNKMSLRVVLTAMLAIAVAFAFTAAPASAASKKTVSLIKGHGLKYYSTGLVKEIDDDVVTTEYKYDSKGNVKEVKKYNCDDGRELENKYTFSYNKKGKLKKVTRYDYEDGKVVKKQKCGLSVGKNNRIKELSFVDRYYYNKITLEGEYDSKGRIKQMTEVYQSLEDGNVTVDGYIIERDSKGYITKSIQRLDSGDDYVFTHTTKIKSGKVDRIKMLDLSDNTTRTYKFKYMKKKIDKKYVSAVKAQQLEMLYIDTWWCRSPVYYLAQINN